MRASADSGSPKHLSKNQEQKLQAKSLQRVSRYHLHVLRYHSSLDAHCKMESCPSIARSNGSQLYLRRRRISLNTCNCDVRYEVTWVRAERIPIRRPVHVRGVEVRTLRSGRQQGRAGPTAAIAGGLCPLWSGRPRRALHRPHAQPSFQARTPAAALGEASAPVAARRPRSPH